MNELLSPERGSVRNAGVGRGGDDRDFLIYIYIIL